MLVFVEGSRSAEPPMKFGTFGAKALITSPEALRVETGLDLAPSSESRCPNPPEADY